MKLPRPTFGSGVLWFSLWKQERRENRRLRRELREWQAKVLVKAGHTPLFYDPPKVETREAPPIGVTAKKAYLAKQPQSSERTDEEILEAARRAASGNGGQ